MGAHKRERAERLKAERRQKAFAKLNDCPVSPRKMRLVVDIIRGKGIEEALQILKFNAKSGASYLEKLLLSAISNWQVKNAEADIEQAELYIKEIRVDQAGVLKRLRPRAQGRADQIKKRSSHVTLVLGEKNTIES